jgi:hypothetical protein
MTLTNLSSSYAGVAASRTTKLWLVTGVLPSSIPIHECPQVFRNSCKIVNNVLNQVFQCPRRRRQQPLLCQCNLSRPYYPVAQTKVKYHNLPRNWVHQRLVGNAPVSSSSIDACQVEEGEEDLRAWVRREGGRDLIRSFSPHFIGNNSTRTGRISIRPPRCTSIPGSPCLHCSPDRPTVEALGTSNAHRAAPDPLNP